MLRNSPSFKYNFRTLTKFGNSVQDILHFWKRLKYTYTTQYIFLNFSDKCFSTQQFPKKIVSKFRIKIYVRILSEYCWNFVFIQQHSEFLVEIQQNSHRILKNSQFLTHLDIKSANLIVVRIFQLCSLRNINRQQALQNELFTFYFLYLC